MTDSTRGRRSTEFREAEFEMLTVLVCLIWHVSMEGIHVEAHITHTPDETMMNLSLGQKKKLDKPNNLKTIRDNPHQHPPKAGTQCAIS